MNARQQFHRKMLNKIKTDRGCETCGYNANPVALQFDHIDTESKFVDSAGRRLSPGSMISYSQAAILSEVAKCRVLCANCHAIHSVEQGYLLRATGVMKTGGRPRKMSEVSDKVDVC